MYSADKLYYDFKEDDKAKPLLEIPQKTSAHSAERDVYLGDNKLVELVVTDFRGNKNKNIAFIMSCIPT